MVAAAVAAQRQWQQTFVLPRLAQIQAVLFDNLPACAVWSALNQLMEWFHDTALWLLPLLLTRLAPLQKMSGTQQYCSMQSQAMTQWTLHQSLLRQRI